MNEGQLSSFARQEADRPLCGEKQIYSADVRVDMVSRRVSCAATSCRAAFLLNPAMIEALKKSNPEIEPK